MPSSCATTLALCSFAEATRYGSPPIHHSRAAASDCATPRPGATLTQPRTPYDPATRPISISRSGGLLGKLLHEPLGGWRELRTAPLPVLHALDLHAQRLTALRRFGIVKADALEKLARRRPARVRHHQAEERALVGAAALQPNHDHSEVSANCEKARIIREKYAL